MFKLVNNISNSRDVPQKFRSPASFQNSSQLWLGLSRAVCFGRGECSPSGHPGCHPFLIILQHWSQAWTASCRFYLTLLELCLPLDRFHSLPLSARPQRPVSGVRADHTRRANGLHQCPPLYIKTWPRALSFAAANSYPKRNREEKFLN